MPTEFCANCFTELHGEDDRCAKCGQPREGGWEKTSFDTRLIRALNHPVADVRLRAIYALGRRKVIAAIDLLVDLAFIHPFDPVQGKAIVEALIEMSAPHAKEALMQLHRDHPSHAVREQTKLYYGKAP
ncbi:MAG: HEAT repeat domain-containing protein [Gammaproteobacteria bacterium]